MGWGVSPGRAVWGRGRPRARRSPSPSRWTSGSCSPRTAPAASTAGSQNSHRNWNIFYHEIFFENEIFSSKIYCHGHKSRTVKVMRLVTRRWPCSSTAVSRNWPHVARLAAAENTNNTNTGYLGQAYIIRKMGWDFDWLKVTFLSYTLLLSTLRWVEAKYLVVAAGSKRCRSYIHQSPCPRYSDSCF